MNTLALIQWQQPAWALLILLPLLLMGWGMLRRRRLQNYAEEHLRPWAVRQGAGLGRWRSWLQLVAWGLLVAALADPRLPAPETAEGDTALRGDVSLLVLLDVSASMRAEDIAPSRGQRAQLELQDLLQRLQGERVGLMAFARRATLVLDPTDDVNVVRHLLPPAMRALGDKPGTALHEALRQAEAVLAEAQAESRAVLLLTDGDATALGGEVLGRLTTIAERLGQQDMPLYILGLGTPEGATIPLDGMGVVTVGGEPVISRMDAAVLERLAELSGGAYATARDGDGDWEALYDEGMAALPSRHAQAITERLDAEHWQPLYGYFLLPGLALLLLALLPLPRHQAPTVLVLLALAAWLLLPGTVEAADPEHQPAWQAYAAEDYVRAQGLYARVRGYDGRMGEGAAAYRLGDFRHAQTQFRLALVLADNDTARADALFNLGNALLRSGAPAEAIEAYEGLLAHYRPGDEAAKDNLWLAQSRLAERQQAPFQALDRPGTRESEFGRYDESVTPDFPEEDVALETPTAVSETGEADRAVAEGRVQAEARDVQRLYGDSDIGRALARAAEKKLEMLQDTPQILLQNQLYHQPPVYPENTRGPTW